jgi:cytochrome c oxidase subunit II
MEVNRYEKFWIGITIAAIILMIVILVLTGFSLGVQLPGQSGAINPQNLASEPPFDKPGVYQISPGQYEVVMVAQTWSFNPKEIHVPVGSNVTIKATSKDVTHGLFIEGTNINMMIIPGQIVEENHTFDKPGTYTFMCHEYCGVGHQTMSGKIIVEP